MAKTKKKYVAVSIQDYKGRRKVNVEVIKSFEYKGANFSVIKTPNVLNAKLHGKYNAVENRTGLMASVEKDIFMGERNSMLSQHTFIPRPTSIEKCISNTKYNIDIFLLKGGNLERLINEAERLDIENRVSKSIYLKFKNLGLW